MDKARDVGEGTSPADASCPGQQRPKPLLALSINPDISAAPFHPQIHSTAPNACKLAHPKVAAP